MSKPQSPTYKLTAGAAQHVFAKKVSLDLAAACASGPTAMLKTSITATQLSKLRNSSNSNLNVHMAPSGKKQRRHTDDLALNIEK